MSSSIKDKPLKKIVCDTRTTIDYIHNKKINEISKNIDKKNDISQQICDIKNKIKGENDNNILNEYNNKLNNLKNSYKNLDNFTNHTSYYLDNGLILADYYNKSCNFTNPDNISNQKDSKKTILDFLKTSNSNRENSDENINENINRNTNDIINNYMINIDDAYINDFKLNEINICKNCKTNFILKNIDSLLICETCGYTENIIVNLDGNSYKDPIRESTYFAYKRINHFNEWLAQFQAKETTDISEEVYNNIIKELYKDKNFNVKNINQKMIRDILKKLKYNKFYEHIPHIINIISGNKSPILSRENEEQLRNMFKEIQNPFIRNCPEDRKNFLSYSYVLHKFCELLELDEMLGYFPLLKSREKLQQQDNIWKKICNDLKWQYIPSV